MPRGKRLSDVEKGKIEAFYEDGVGLREIGCRINRSLRVIQNFLNDKENYGKKKSTGRKSKLSERDKRKIINTASNSMVSCAQITKQYQLNVSRHTVFRVLKECKNIQRQKLKKIPKLLPRHIDARMQFARNNMNTDWSKVQNRSYIRSRRLHCFVVPNN